MQSKMCNNILAKRGEEAGLDHFSPHDLRRTFVGTYSTPARTSVPFKRWPDIATSRRLVVTTAVQRWRSVGPPSCYTSRWVRSGSASQRRKPPRPPA